MLIGLVCRLTIAVTCSTAAFGAVIHNEAVDGDFSNMGLTPTPVLLSTGSNEILGTTGRVGAVIDRDYLTFVVPVGSVLSSIIELAGTTAGGDIAFIGLQAGNVFTVAPNAVDATGLLGWVHYPPTAQDVNLLPVMSIPNNGSSGFAGPLRPGAYSLWIQEFAAGSFPYGFSLQITEIPEPATWWMAGIAVSTIAALKRRLRAHRQ